MFELFQVYFLSSNVHSCFFYLNDSDLKRSEYDKRAINIKFGEKHENMTYGSVSSKPLLEIPPGHIGISSYCGLKLGLREKEVVVVSSCDVDAISSLEILPKREEDYVILLSCRSILETYLLNQLSVVAEGQVLPVFVFSNISIDVEIGKVNLTCGYGRLQKFTEITVLHPSEKISNAIATKPQNLTEKDTTGDKTKFLNIIYNNLSVILNNKTLDIQIDEQRSREIILKNLIRDNPKRCRNSEFKIQPSFMLDNNLPKKILSRFIVVSHLENENSYGSHCVKIYAQVQKVKNVEEERDVKETNKKDDSLSLHSFVISLNRQGSKTAICPSYVMTKLKLYVGSKIRIKELKPNKRNFEKNWPGVVYCDTESECFWKSIKEIRENITRTTLNNFKYNYKINSLIEGETGSGKTFLLEDIVKKFRSDFVYCKVLQCKSLRGKKITTLQQLLTDNLRDCICHEPSLLVLDDLHALTYVTEGEDQFSRLYSNRVVELITSTLDDFQQNYNLTVIASTASLPQLSTIVQRHGPRLFQNVLRIPEMSPRERSFALKSLITQRSTNGNEYLSSLDFDKLSSSTNGYTIQNLSDVVDKAIFNCLLRNEGESLSKLSQIDFEAALSDSAPVHLRSVKLKQNIEIMWDDVGGMVEPKKILTEVFSWPLKYPDLLESCPLRLQRGVLLYGAPGTGKTLLAGALANKCGLNFISVKGPEVLSKYVGASEEGVRSLFVQAQKTRPCLLFFDEFDSLAPKRGHDSSGVTDRVVNQILTQLDGVESLNGVWVLAATSRPDLLDPALLRPGRLDKLVFCEIPNQPDRLSILEVLSKSLSMKEDVNLKEIAEKTEGYTGADLHAVLYNAQMSAIKNIQSSSEKSSNIKISHFDFLTAFSEVKPSLSQKEKMRYDKIYDKFLKSRKKNDTESYNLKQRVTLA